MEKGLVCDDCNQKFSKLDVWIRNGHPMMMLAYQRNPRIRGKRKGGGDEKRQREKNKIFLQGIDEMTVSRVDENGLNKDGGTFFLNNPVTLTTNEKFLRAIHKCLVNSIACKHGVAYCKENFHDLINFVLNGGNSVPWGYGVSFQQNFPSRCFDAQPCLLTFDSKAGSIFCLVILHSSGIWAVGSMPYSISPKMLEKISDAYLNSHPDIDRCEKIINRKFPQVFGQKFDEIRTQFGELKFYWATEEFQSTDCLEFKDDVRLLTECRYCGQTNPVGIVIPRERISKDLRKNYQFVPNSWNLLDEKMLAKIGFEPEFSEKREKVLRQGMRILLNSEDLGIELVNCNYNCFKCKENNILNSRDCFI